MKRTLCLFLALILAVGICFSAPVTITASAANDITVTIDTGASVTLKDADGDGYYDIGTADELYAFAAAVNGGKKTINVELTADITINENVPTADSELNGSNFRVWTPIGYYNSSDDELMYSGTFHGNDKTISGLYFNNSNVSYVGLFSMVDYGGKIENVSVIDSYTRGKSNVGGVVGVNEGTVTNCYNKGTVSGSYNVGGVVGSSNGTMNTVTNCYNEGNVSGAGESVGGVVGVNTRTVEDCYNKGTVSGNSNVGGVVGSSNGTMNTVTNCYNEGNVSGTGERVGGVVGYSNGGTMTNCYNKGTVSGSSSVGGVVGSSIGTVTNCYNEGNVSGTSERVGGVVGIGNRIVTNCYNKGTVSGSYYVGGVVGQNSSAVTNCYNEGTVSGTGERVGGVFGYNYGNGKNCYYLSGCATDGNNVTQFGIGNMTLGSTTADVSGQTDSKTADWFTSGEVCAAVGYHQGADAANGFCDLCIYDPATLNEDKYYEISNAGQLFWFADYINTEDRTANAVLTADIDLENRPWTPIGKTDENSNNFRGHFDGQNHTIKGLYIERSSKGIGFFGEVRTGIVENFTIYGEVNVKGECDYVGGVFGSTCGLSSSNNELERNGAIIRNITSYVNLTAGAHGIGRIGGFVGYANHETLIENCSWYGTFDAGSYRVDTGAGGFIGNVHEGSNVTIRNCAAYGTIKTNYKKNSYDSKDNIYMGGFLSYSESDANTTLENCLFAGKFEKGENLTDQALLGAFGTLKSVNSIVNCYYLGDDGLEAVHSDSALKPGSDNVEITSVTKAQLLSGEVAYKLQGEENTHFWGQTIDTDDYPVLGGDKVYYGYISCADDAKMVYTNNENAVTEKPKHTGGTASCKEKAVCENCGDSYGDFAPHTYISGKCTAEGCGYACAHENKDENGICTVCKSTSGSCGENVTWIYDDNTKTLTISGTGAMANYTGYDMPWYNYQSNITKVVIENGVTTIGDYAFWDCSTLTSVTILDRVTTIGESAFSGCFGLTSVTIPYSVTTIGDGAFSGCTSLTSVTIPDNVTTIGDGAFSSCTELIEIKVAEGNTNYLSVDGILFSADKTELLCYPAGKKGNYEILTTVTKIAPGAFSGNTSLESVIIPDSVTTIDDGAFMDCTALTSVTIPDSVTTIGSYAFQGCTSLASVTIGDRVTTIGWQTFYDCTALTSVTIGKGVTEIGDCAFESCTSLTTIEIPDSVTAIGESAFYYCTSLTSVTIGKGVTEINDYAFDGCATLTTVNVPCSWNENPKYTTFENSVTVDIQKHNYELGVCTACKYDCTHEDKDEKGTCTVCCIADGTCGENVTWVYDSKTTILTITGKGDLAGYTIGEAPWEAHRESIRGIDIKDGVTSIGNGTFCGCVSLTSVIIPGSVKIIGVNAFSGCEKLSNVRISEGVTSIGNYAFQNCTLLKEITIPESVTEIGERAFFTCQNLMTITIPKNVTVIGEGAFSNCTRLTEINVDEGNTTYSSEDGVLFNEGKTELICCPAGKVGDYEVPSGVTSISNYAFSSRGEFFAVTIPVSVTTIGDYAFVGSQNVNLIVEPGSYAHEFATTNSIPYTFNGYTEAETDQIEKLLFTLNADSESYSVTFCDAQISGALKIPATYNGKPVTEIGNYAFANCISLTSVTIPDSVTTIGAGAFNSCFELISITIPESVTAIGSYAFDGCAILASISVDDANTKYSSVDGVLFNKDKTELICYPTGQNAKSYTILDSVITIGEDAFKNCTELTSVTIPDSVTTIGESAFYGCSELTSVKIGNGVTEIDDYAFWYCTSLTTVNVPCNWDTENPPYAFDENVLKKYHNIVIDEAVEATCTATGLTKGQHCTRCDAMTIIQEEVPALNHKDTLVQVEAKAPTCEAIGWDAYEHCTECDYTTYKEKAKLGHDIVSHSAKSATCEAIGWYAYDTCSRCDYTTYKEIAKLGHDIVIDKAVEATCTKTGLTEGQHCTRCDAMTIIQEEVPARNHKDTLVQVEAKAPTCEAIGWDAYEYCTACNYTTYVEKAKLGHDIVIDKAVAPTCTKTGLTEGSHCSRCDDKTVKQNVIPTKAHTEVTVTGKAATCTATGLTDGKKCSVCGVTTVEQNVIPTKAHTEVTVTGKAATCTATGLTDGKKCSVCGTVTKAQETIKATGHTTSVINKKDATCTADGYTGDTYCSVCKTTIAKGKAIAKLGHSYNAGEITTKATCEKDGVKTFTCTRCKATKTETIKATGHKEVVIPAVAPTYTTVGKTEGKKCSVCGIVTVAQKDVAKLTLATPVVTAVANNSGIKVNWNNVENAQSYVLYKRVFDATANKWSKWKIVKTGLTGFEYIDSDVVLGTKYRYTVRAKNGDTLSPYKTTTTVKYNVTPTVKVANDSNGVKVTWTTVANATGYRVYRSTLSNGKWSNWKNMGTAKSNKTSWTDKSVKSNVTYKYTVRAVYNKVLSSYNKAGASVLFLSTPTVKIANNASGIKVSWNKIAGATGYTVYSSTYDAKTKKWSSWKNRGTAKANKTSWVDKNVKSGVKYKYTVRAVNGKTESTYVSSGDLLYLAQPAVTVKSVSNGINISWTKSSGATEYKIYRSEYNAKTKKWSSWKGIKSAKSTVKSYTDKTTKKGVKYKYTVRAINGKVKSSYKASNSISK